MILHQLQAEFDTSPFYSRYGIKLSMGVEGNSLLELPSSDIVIGNPSIKAIHGGLVAMALELAASCQIALVKGEKLQPLSQTTSFMRKTSASSLYASASVTKQGRRFTVTEAKVWQKDIDRPVATAVFTFQSKG